MFLKNRMSWQFVNRKKPVFYAYTQKREKKEKKKAEFLQTTL